MRMEVDKGERGDDESLDCMCYDVLDEVFCDGLDE